MLDPGRQRHVAALRQPTWWKDKFDTESGESPGGVEENKNQGIKIL